MFYYKKITGLCTCLILYMLYIVHFKEFLKILMGNNADIN